VSLRCLAIAALWILLAGSATPARAQSPGARPVASSDGFIVDEDHLDAWWQAHDATTYSKVRRDLYDGRRKALDALLGDFLLEREARSRRTTVQAVLDEELPGRTSAVTDSEIRELYEASLPLPEGVTFEQVKPMIAAYLQGKHVEDARARFVEELRRMAGVVVDLEPPRQVITVGAGDPVTSPAQKPVEIVEFADFQCPYCRQLEPVLKQLRSKYADRLRLIWKDFPLSIHAEARGAAEAARCAADQQRFWEYHDLLFANQQALAPDDLKRHARALGLDETRFTACLEGGSHRTEVAAGLEEGMRQGVQATPTVFVNGRPIIGVQRLEAYEKVVLEELDH